MKHRSLKQIFATLVLVAITTALTTPVHAMLIMTLEGQSSSPVVTVTLSGSDVVTSEDFTGPICCAFMFDITDDSNPFTGLIGLLEDFTFNGSATVSNLTSGLSSNVTAILTQDKRVFPDRFGVGIPANPFYTLSRGDEFSWSGSGTIDLSEHGFGFDDLNLGTYDGSAILPEVGNTGVDGRLIVRSRAIPEPTTLALIGLSLASIGLVRKKRLI